MANATTGPVLAQPRRGEAEGFTWGSAEARQVSTAGEWDVVGQQHQILFMILCYDYGTGFCRRQSSYLVFTITLQH